MKSRMSRSAEAALAALALVALTAAPALAAGYRGVTVDTRELAARGARGAAQQVQACLPEAAGRSMAPFLNGDRSAPTVVVRVTAIQLTAQPSTGQGSRGFDDGGSSDQDYLEGEVLTVRGNTIVSRAPLLTSVQPAGDRAATVDIVANERTRVRALCETMAGWIPWTLGIR